MVNTLILPSMSVSGRSEAIELAMVCIRQVKKIHVDMEINSDIEVFFVIIEVKRLKAMQARIQITAKTKYISNLISSSMVGAIPSCARMNPVSKVMEVPKVKRIVSNPLRILPFKIVSR